MAGRSQHRNSVAPAPCTRAGTAPTHRNGEYAMRTCGLDVHKRETEACVIDDTGGILHRERFPTTRESLEDFARRHLGPDARVALEATTNTWGIVGVLAPLCASVTPSNPMRTRAIAEAKVKTDKVDALVLAQLLRTDFLPGVWVPDDRTRILRELTSRRAVLVVSVPPTPSGSHGLALFPAVGEPLIELAHG